MPPINNNTPLPPTMIASTATPAERAHFRFLWQKHVNLRKQNKIVYYVPRSLGDKMGPPQLIGMATNLATYTQSNVYIHLDEEHHCFRVGQVVDTADSDSVSQFDRLYTAVYTPPIASPSLVESTVPTPTRAIRRSKFAIDHIPKPRNSWVIYRQDKHYAAAAENPGMHNSLLSKVIAAMWRAEPTEVRHFYAKRSIEEKKDHKLLYPGYKCQPRKSSEIKKRKVKSKGVILSQPQAVVTDMAGGIDSFPSDATNRLFEGFENIFSAHQSADLAGENTNDLFNTLDNMFVQHQEMDFAGAATAGLFNTVDGIFVEHQGMDFVGGATAGLFDAIDSTFADHQGMDITEATAADEFQDFDGIVAEDQGIDLAGATTADFFDTADWAEIEEIQGFPGTLETELPSLELSEFSEIL